MHAYVRIAGHSLAIVPLLPLRIARVGQHPSSLLMTDQTALGPEHVSLTIDEQGYQLAGSSAQTAPERFVEIEVAGYGADWRLETSLYTLGWPQAFTIQLNTEAAQPPLFDLIGPDDALIYLQGPFQPGRLPAREAMTAPGQEVAAMGELADYGWVELTYQHQGKPWLQRHYVVSDLPQRVFVVTMQAPEPASVGCIEATELVVTTLRPYEAEPG